MSLTSAYAHYSSIIELRVSQEPAIPGCFMVKAPDEPWADISIFIPSKYRERLVRAVAAFNREMQGEIEEIKEAAE